MPKLDFLVIFDLMVVTITMIAYEILNGESYDIDGYLFLFIHPPGIRFLIKNQTLVHEVFFVTMNIYSFFPSN